MTYIYKNNNRNYYLSDKQLEFDEEIKYNKIKDKFENGFIFEDTKGFSNYVENGINYCENKEVTHVETSEERKVVKMYSKDNIYFKIKDKTLTVKRDTNGNDDPIFQSSNDYVARAGIYNKPVESPKDSNSQHRNLV